MTFREPTAAELSALLTAYCAACIAAAHDARWNDQSLAGPAGEVAATARARECTTAELFLAFEVAWNRDGSWAALPAAMQSATYDQSLSLLASRFLERG